MINLMQNYLDAFILGILGFMSLILVWLSIERFLYYRQVPLGEFTDRESLTIALTHHLTTLSSIGANAPYVGLLGTVLGILITFHQLGQSGHIAANQMMLGLALALKATALGLVVAIPAILMYNGFLRKIDVLTAQWGQLQRAQGKIAVDQGEPPQRELR
ncbi:MAG: TonB-system energizer ExbB [Halothiobacillus sp. 20-54-6]|nr:MAG: TonB-system energizer ExbB [Halothiobacillus sp. 20-54-6]